MFRNYAILFAFIFLGLGCRSIAENSTTSEDRVGDSPVRVATSGDYRPFSTRADEMGDDALIPQGFSIDVARAYAQARGLEIQWVPFRWPALLSELRDDRFDFAISGVTVRPERSIAGLFSLPLTTSGALVLVPESSPAKNAKDLDHAAMRLAVNGGGHLERVARRLFPHAEIEAVGRNADVLGRLLEGGAHGVVTDTLEAPHWEARAGVPLLRIGPLSTDRKAALFEPTAHQLARDFDLWLIGAEARGDLAELRALHRLPSGRTAEPVAALLASLDERLALMISVARAKAALDIEVENLQVEARVLEAAWTSVAKESQIVGLPAPPPAAIRQLFRAQIEAAKWIQREELRRLGEPGRGAVPESASGAYGSRTQARSHLEEALRPALIRIGDRIAFLIARLPGVRTSNLGFEETRSALSRHGLPESELRAIHEALLSLLPPSSAPHASTHRPRRAGADRMPSV